MTTLSLVIEDQIRDEGVRARLDVDMPVRQIIAWLVEEFGLPQRDFDLSRIDYRLVRARDGARLRVDMTLRRAGLASGDSLLLVSPKGRRVWQIVQRLLDEIEAEIEDRVTGKLKDRVIEEVWDRVTRKLDEIEKTRTGGNRVQRVREWVRRVGGPAHLVDIAEQAADAAELYRSSSSVQRGPSGWIAGGLAALGVGGLAFLVIIILVLANLFGGGGDGEGAPAAPAEPIQPAATQIQPEEPAEADSDGDGLTDAEEAEVGTDPFDPDSDGDELLDGEEVFGYGTDPLNVDSDNDGLWDGRDEIMMVSEQYGSNSDPLDADTDGDGYQDGEEVLELGSNPLDPGDPGGGIEQEP